MANREDWLNGWPRIGDTVLVGNGVHCAGCGLSMGVTTVAFAKDWEPPTERPTWPFDEATCPICGWRNRQEIVKPPTDPARLPK